MRLQVSTDRSLLRLEQAAGGSGAGPEAVCWGSVRGCEDAGGLGPLKGGGGVSEAGTPAAGALEVRTSGLEAGP